MTNTTSSNNTTEIAGTLKKADKLAVAEEKSLKVLIKLFEAVTNADENTDWITRQDVDDFVQEITEKERFKNGNTRQVIQNKYCIGSGKYHVEVRIENPAKGCVKYLFLYEYNKVIKWVAFL